MKKLLLLLTLLLSFSFQMFAQVIPTINVGENQLKLKSIDIQVEIIGNKATTTYDMVFSNTTNNVLEGELSFPLGEGHTVSRFALDINGDLREAVVVEKELGRVAFENTIRQKIDPALLEQTKGNNYKARIYPIPANGTKRVVLAYDQVLISNNNNFSYLLPLNFKDKLKEFSLKIEAFNQEITPKIVKSNFDNLEFNNWSQNYKIDITKKNFLANTPLLIEIPVKINSEKLILNEEYFYLYKTIQTKIKSKENPKKITILWDTSFSMRYRDVEKEIALLDLYFKRLLNGNVHLVTFSNEVGAKKYFKINNSNWSALKKYLEQDIVYDGGTSFQFLSNYKDNSDEYLLFTDGMVNLSKNEKFDKKPVYTINSISASNHKLLSQYSEKSGGVYINLNNYTAKQSVDLLINQPYRFLGVKTQQDSKLEYYPSKSMNITSDFSFAGKNFKNGEKIELLFGFGNEVSEAYEISIDTGLSESTNLTKIWAELKLKELLENQEENKEKIIDLGKEYQLISPYTSLIVLDRVEDYVKYKIEPPKELLKEYRELLEKRDDDVHVDNEITDVKEELEEEYNDLFDWWKTKFNFKKKKKLKKVRSQASIQENSSVTQTEHVELQNESSDYGSQTITGIVTDGTDSLPGVSVVVKGTTTGTETDFDGNYSLSVNVGDILEYSFVGMDSAEKTVGGTNTINVILEGNALDEVIVSGFARRVERRSSTFSVQSISSEQISVAREVNVANSLSGKISGVQVTSSSGSVGASSRIVLRGASSITGNKEPLYVINGVPLSVNGKEVLKSINPDDIKEINVLKGPAAAALYGVRASNGVIEIITKNSDEIKRDKIYNSTTESSYSKIRYIKKIQKTTSVKDAYKMYLSLINKYKNSASFYLDVSDFFISIKEKKIAIKILTNIAEMDIDNYELLRVFAYKLEALGEYSLAVYVYEETLKLRPEDIQSYRDLALAYEEVGRYQKSLDLLYKIVNGELIKKDIDRRFEGIEVIALNEMNSLILRYKKELNLQGIDEKYIRKIPVDIRVVVDWNHNDTDIDLYVLDPNDEECYYSHEITKIGGRISADMTEGFGPEEFLLKKAIKGKYVVNIDYYSDNVQKISEPTFLKITTYLNFGKTYQEKKVKVVRLDKEEDELIVATIEI